MLTLALLAGAVVAMQAQTPAPSSSPSEPAVAVVIPAGMKVPLHVAETISSHDAHTGQTFTFYVDQDVAINGNVVISRCAAGSGTVTLAGRHGFYW